MALVILLTSSVVAIVYVCLLPLILQTYPLPWIFWHIIYGHWNLVMIVFHYYMAITTPPGYPPQVGAESPVLLLWPFSVGCAGVNAFEVLYWDQKQGCLAEFLTIFWLVSITHTNSCGQKTKAGCGCHHVGLWRVWAQGSSPSILWVSAWRWHPWIRMLSSLRCSLPTAVKG